MHRDKPPDKHAAEFDLTAHEASFPGDKQILKNNQGISTHHAKLLVAGVDTFFALSFFIGLAAENKGDPFRRQGECYSDAHADIEANVICQHKNSPRAIIAKAATKEDYERWIIQFKWIVERLISR